LLRDQERRLSLILGEVRRLTAHGPDASTAERLEQAQTQLLDPLYVAFEDRFRGSRADIKQRQRVYLDLLTSVGAGTPERPIVDVGSGRGELLEMLDEAGLQARGVDLNQAMVSLCTGMGLDVVHDDAVAYLSRLESASLGAVTGFHIIEHLPFPALVALIDASLHALAPGGVVIFETPNPANLLVASRWFYLDPTHRNPLPGEMVSMIAEARGFIDVEIRELHPMQRRFEAHDHVLAGQLNAIFYGPQDYALIARKP
jgi:O-antigen chain-terminating methyltransferase